MSLTVWKKNLNLKQNLLGKLKNKITKRHRNLKLYRLKEKRFLQIKQLKKKLVLPNKPREEKENCELNLFLIILTNKDRSV